ncbi:MAG: hypothetical protein GX455_16865 [Phycisphaerae bacterium]|nr:hypothetical protein [Phycisphaerae bacterium]
MVSFNQDIRMIKLTEQEQLAILQHCPSLPQDLYQRVFSAQDGCLNLTPDECQELRSVIKEHLDQEVSSSIPGVLGPVFNKLSNNPFIQKIAEELSGKDYDNIEQLQAHLDTLNRRHNTTPDPELGNLSPNQVQRLISTPWDHPACPMKFNQDLTPEDVKDSPLFFNSVLLLEELLARQDEPTATAKGNLNRKVIEALRPNLKTIKQVDSDYFQQRPIYSETELVDLWIPRLICLQAGFVRKLKNKFLVTKLGQEMLQSENTGRLFCQLFTTYFVKHNIAFYSPIQPDFSFVQGTIAFSIYRLGKSKDHQGSIKAIAQRLVLPGVYDDICKRIHKSWLKPEWIIETKVIDPLEWAGLITCRREKVKYLYEIKEIKTTELYHKFVRFAW